MKRTVLQIIAIIGFAVCSASYAQAQNAEVYRTDIPFEFHVGKKVFPAGEYRVEVRGFEQKYFVLKDAEGRNSHIANSIPGRATVSNGARLDFQRIGGNYFLASVSASDRTSYFPKALVDDMLARNTESEKLTVKLSYARPSKDRK